MTKDPKRILTARSKLTADEIATLSAGEAWKVVYQIDKAEAALKQGSKQSEVCFTGFTSVDRDRLSSLAINAGLVPKEVVTKGLALLVTGPNAGESKIRKAESQATAVTDEAGFLALINELNL